MQDLNDILCFAAVAEHNGFSAAARALNRPKSSISRQVDRLEARLGVRLLERSTRRVRLTEVGSEYYARCQAVLDDLERADRDVAIYRSDPVGIIRVTCPTGIAREVMPRIISGFLNALSPGTSTTSSDQPIRKSHPGKDRRGDPRSCRTAGRILDDATARRKPADFRGQSELQRYPSDSFRPSGHCQPAVP